MNNIFLNFLLLFSTILVWKGFDGLLEILMERIDTKIYHRYIVSIMVGVCIFSFLYVLNPESKQFDSLKAMKFNNNIKKIEDIKK